MHNKGRILVVVKHLGTNRVFGGYVEDVFTGETKTIDGSPFNFVFSLDQAQPIKLFQSPDKFGVRMSTRTHGFWLGGGVSDLRVFSLSGDDSHGCCYPWNYCTPDVAYPCKNPQGKVGLLAGLTEPWDGSNALAEVFQCE